MLTNLRWNLPEKYFLEYVVKGNISDSFSDVRCQLLRAATFSRKTVEEGVHHVLLGASVGVTEVVEKGRPLGVCDALQHLVDLGVVAARELAL